MSGERYLLHLWLMGLRHARTACRIGIRGTESSLAIFVSASLPQMGIAKTLHCFGLTPDDLGIAKPIPRRMSLNYQSDYIPA